MCKNRRTGKRRTLLAAVLAAALASALFGAFRPEKDAGEDEAVAAAAAAYEAEDAEARDVTALVTLDDVDSVNSRSCTLAVTEASAVSEKFRPASLRASAASKSELSYRRVEMDDIPLLEIYKDDGQPKTLLLFLHGVSQSKEFMAGALEDFAEAGYYAVSMDAYGHGERAAEGTACDNWASMLITVGDIDRVVEYYAGVEGVQTENFILGGFSMGGIETWAYVQLGSYRPAALLPMAGVCDVSAWQPERLGEFYNCWLESNGYFVQMASRYQEPDYTREKYRSITELNVLDNLDAYTDIPIFCAMGTEDSYFRSDAAASIFAQLRERGNTQAVFTAYEGGIHWLTDSMIADCIDFLQSLKGTGSLSGV